jgi:hypothetical protein
MVGGDYPHLEQRACQPDKCAEKTVFVPIQEPFFSIAAVFKKPCMPLRFSLFIDTDMYYY